MGTALSQSPTLSQHYDKKTLNRLSTPNLAISTSSNQQQPHKMQFPTSLVSPNKKSVKFKNSTNRNYYFEPQQQPQPHQLQQQQYQLQETSNRLKSNHFSFPDGFLVRIKSNGKVNNHQTNDLSTSIVSSSSSSSTSGVVSSASSILNTNGVSKQTENKDANKNSHLLKLSSTSSSSYNISSAPTNPHSRPHHASVSETYFTKKNSRITSLTKKFKQNFLPDSKNKKNSHHLTFVNSSSSSSCTPSSFLSSSASSTRSSLKTNSKHQQQQQQQQQILKEQQYEKQCTHEINNVDSCIQCYENLKKQQKKELKSSNGLSSTFLNKLNLIRKQRLRSKSPSVAFISTESTVPIAAISNSKRNSENINNKITMRPKSERMNTKSMFIENFNVENYEKSNRLSSSNSFKMKLNSATSNLIKNSLSVFNLKSSTTSVQSSGSSSNTASSSSSSSSSASSSSSRSSVSSLKKKNNSVEESEATKEVEPINQMIDEETQEHQNNNQKDNLNSSDSIGGGNKDDHNDKSVNETADTNISVSSKSEINSLKTINTTTNINTRMFVNNNNEDLLNRQQQQQHLVQKQEEKQDNIQPQLQQQKEVPDSRKMNNVALLQKNFSYLNVNATLCKCRTCITKQEVEKHQHELEKRLVEKQIKQQQQRLELNNEQQSNQYVTTSSLTSKQHSKVVIQASTNELLRSLINFLAKRCSYIKDLNANESLQWIKNADRQLILQGWQEIAFLNPANIVFVYMLIRDTLNLNQNSIQTATEFKYYLLSCLYLAFSYMGNEISYPLKPFIFEESRDTFWQRIIKLIGQLSKQMLRINQDTKYFTDVFTELKKFSNLNEINNKDVNLFKKFQQNISQQFQQRESNLMSASLSILNNSMNIKQNRLSEEQQQQQLKMRRLSYMNRQQADSRILANQHQYFQQHQQLKLQQQQIKQQQQQQQQQTNRQIRNIMTKSCNGADIFVNRFPV